MKTSARLCCVFGTPLLFHPGGQDTLLLPDENTASLVLKTVQVLAKYNQGEVLTISRQCRHEEEKPRFCCHRIVVFLSILITSPYGCSYDCSDNPSYNSRFGRRERDRGTFCTLMILWSMILSCVALLVMRYVATSVAMALSLESIRRDLSSLVS